MFHHLEELNQETQQMAVPSPGLAKRIRSGGAPGRSCLKQLADRTMPSGYRDLGPALTR
jgi:hypothetical protein